MLGFTHTGFVLACSVSEPWGGAPATQLQLERERVGTVGLVLAGTTGAAAASDEGLFCSVFEFH